jgi:hypothetical protein
MSGTFLAVVKGRERRFQWNEQSLEEAVERVGETNPSSDLATADISIFHITNSNARKVWQGTPADARAGRGYVTEEPAPPCKYPVGTVIYRGTIPRTITATRLAWVYDYLLEGFRPTRGVYEAAIDAEFTLAPPDPYPVGSEHVVDLGFFGCQTAKVVAREGDGITFIAVEHRLTSTLAEFEKAVVK